MRRVSRAKGGERGRREVLAQEKEDIFPFCQEEERNGFSKF